MGFEAETLLGRAQFYVPWSDALETIFAIVFLVELAMRIAVEGWRSYVPGSGVRKSISVWNLLEALIVLVSCVTAWLDFGSPSDDSGARPVLEVITVLRVCRLMRVARIASRVKLFREVWVLLRGLAGSMRVLFWTTVVIFIITYMFAVFGVVIISVEIEDRYEMVLHEKRQAMDKYRASNNCSAAAQGVASWKSDHPEFDEIEFLYDNTRGIMPWIFTLLQVLTLDSWTSIARPMQDIVDFSWVLFYLYIAIVVFVLMNLVTAIIVENALKRSREDEKEIRQQKKREQRKAEKRCRKLFSAIDDDGDENITIEELRNACEDPWLGRQLQVLDINTDNADEVFKMMDTGDGVLSLDEFFEGTQRMQGPAEGKDMVRVLAITQRLARDILQNVAGTHSGLSRRGLQNVTGARRGGMSSESLSPALDAQQDILQKLDGVCKLVETLEEKMYNLSGTASEVQQSPAGNSQPELDTSLQAYPGAAPRTRTGVEGTTRSGVHEAPAGAREYHEHDWQELELGSYEHDEPHLPRLARRAAC